MEPAARKRQRTSSAGGASGSSSSIKQEAAQQWPEVLRCVMAHGGDPVAAWRAACQTPPLADIALNGPWLQKAARPLLRCATTGRTLHPVAALTRTACPHARDVLVRLMRADHADNDDDADEVEDDDHHDSMGMNDADDELEGVDSLAQLVRRLGNRACCKLKGTTERHEALLAQRHGPQAVAARDHAVRGPFTYQFVMRDRPYGPRDRREVVNGETARREFVTFADAHETLAFLTKWYALQRVAPAARRLTLQECGSHDRTLRKWILDIDAERGALETHGFSTDPDVLFACVLRFAQAFCAALHDLGFVASPPPFAVVSRHSPAKQKCSWHITLCALAGFERWRTAIRAVLDFANPRRDAVEWHMLRLVDPAILANTKGQYMQVWGSTKVNPGAPPDGHCFRWEGLWATATDPLPIPDAAFLPLFLSATSAMLHDPWSLLFSQPDPSFERFEPIPVEADPVEGCVREVLSAASAAANKSRKRAAAATAPKAALEDLNGAAAPPLQHRASWQLLPPDEQWMRRFVEASDARTRLAFIPSMAEPRNWPGPVSLALAQSPRTAAVLVHAQVYNIAACPKLLLVEGRVERHKRNTTMLFCLRDVDGRCRMFMRCFSQHCRQFTNHPRILAGHWVEIVRDDYEVMQTKLQHACRKEEGSSSTTTPSTTAAPSVTTLAPSDDELIDMLLAEEDAPDKQEEAEAEEEPAKDVFAASLPAAAAAWMRPLFAGARLRAIHPPLIQNPPPCLEPLFRLKRAKVLLYAAVHAGSRLMPFCPRLYAHLGRREPHRQSGATASAAVLVVAQTDPTCPGTSHRVFALCHHPDCCHLRHAASGHWVEFSKREAALAVSAP